MSRRSPGGCAWAAAIAVASLAAGARAGPALSTDWPAWRGPFSSGASDSGREWVATLDAARQAWVSDPVGLSGCGHGSPDHLATGFCDPVIVGERVFLFWFERSGTNTVEWERIAHSQSFGMRRISASYRDPREAAEQAKFNADDVFVCLSARTGKTLWKRTFAERGFNHRKVYSPVCTPAVSDGRLYGLGSAGRVYCLEEATGKPVWESDVGMAAQHFEQMRALCRETGVRGYEPCGFNHCVMVIDGVVVVGDGGAPLGCGTDDLGLVGLDARTGDLLWRIPRCLYEYGTPSCWRHQGTNYALSAGKSRMIAAEPRSGRLLWEIEADRDKNGRVAEPLSQSVALAVKGDYAVVNGGAPACYRMDLKGARKAWQLPKVQSYCWLVGAVILGDHAYVSVEGGVGCVELETGKLLGTVRGFGAAGIRGYAGGDGHIVDAGLKVVKAWPDFRMLDGNLPGTWRGGYAHSSTVAGGRVYIRGRENVYCYDMRKEPSAGDVRSDPVSTALTDLDAVRDDPGRLAALAQRSDWPTRGAAFERLREMGAAARPAAPKMVEMLRAAAEKADWGDMDLIAAALTAIEPESAKPAVPALIALLKSDDSLAVRLGCHALGIIGRGAAEAVPDLTRLLADRAGPAAPLAARALGRIGPDAAAAVPSLLACLPEDKPVETHETALAVKFDGYARLESLEGRRLIEADKAFAAKNCVLAKTGYEAFRKEFPSSIAVRYAGERIAKCEALMKAADDAAYDGPANPTPDALAYHALDALFRIGGTPHDRLPRLVEFATKHPWVGHGQEGDVLPKHKSFGVLLCRRLGRDAVPMLLAKAHEFADAGHWQAVADVVQAACLLDPGVKEDGLKVIAYAVGPKASGQQPWMGGGSGERMKYVQRDLEGKFDMTDPRGIYKSRKEAAAKTTAEKKEIPEVDEVIPDL